MANDDREREDKVSVDQRRDAILKRMLETPPKPHKPKSKTNRKEQTKK
jgi:hypothetical protein